MKLRYIKIQQKNETFFITKFNALELRDKVNFHFREPYSDDKVQREKYFDYIQRINSKGIDISGDEEGVQRRLQVAKINKIKAFLEKEQESFFPTSVVLNADISRDSKFMQQYLEMEENEFGTVEISDKIDFQIVDGQHRLAGLFIADEEIQKNFEVPAILFFNATKHTCAKVFAEINGNQTPVNRSVIYDLYDLIIPSNDEMQKIKSLHTLCKKFNTDISSPLYQHLKMLGIGQGAISQAFFIKYLEDAIKDCEIEFNNTQKIYSQLYMYLKCFQRIFQDQWPVLEFQDEKKFNITKFSYHSNNVLKNMKSQALKTNGFGAIMMLFPYIYRKVNIGKFSDYYIILKNLSKKIDWVEDKELTQGTGKKNQKIMRDKMLKILGLN